MAKLLNFEVVVVLNLFVLLLWPSSGRYPEGQGRNAVGIIILILTVIAIVVDVIFLVKALMG